MRRVLGLIAFAILIAAIAAPARAQDPTSFPTSTLTDLRAQVCMSNFYGDMSRCVRGFRAIAGPRGAARAHVVLKVTATCTWSPDEDFDTEEVTTSIDRPRLTPREQTWEPCSDDYVYDYPPIGTTYETSRKVSGELDVGAGRRRRSAYPFSVSWAGGSILEGEVVAVRSKYKPKRIRRIWDYQFDPYINTCINGGHQLRASGGHLYCTVTARPASARVAFLLG
jgi:hypothetical protein